MKSSVSRRKYRQHCLGYSDMQNVTYYVLPILRFPTIRQKMSSVSKRLAWEDSFSYCLCLPLLIIYRKMINMGRPFSLLTLTSHVNHFHTQVFYRESRNVHFWPFFTNKKFLIHKIKIVREQKLPMLVPSESTFII